VQNVKTMKASKCVDCEHFTPPINDILGYCEWLSSYVIPELIGIKHLCDGFKPKKEAKKVEA